MGEEKKSESGQIPSSTCTFEEEKQGKGMERFEAPFLVPSNGIVLVNGSIVLVYQRLN